MTNNSIAYGVVLILGILIPVTSFAQNLLRNGDFEHPFTDYDHQWKQPHGPYYHYYQDVAQSGAAFEGQFYNGLCIYNHQENEFLQVQLTQPLEAGQAYCISAMARLMEVKAFNHELHDKIGILFTEKSFNVEEPYDFPYKPQVFWLIPDSVDRMEWMSLDTAYTASGGEMYMTIGYFRGLGLSEKVKREEFEAFLGPQNKTQEESNIPPPDFSNRGKKRRKKRKGGKSNDDWADFRKQVMQEAHSQGEVIPTESPGDGLFTLRYYIDNVCVAPRLEDGKCDCSIDEPAVDLSEGAVVRMDNLLFESGSAELRKESEYALEILTLILNENPDMRIAIHGHTDNVGSDADNLQLSRDRARAVYQYLLEAKIDPLRLAFDGFGASRPVSDNESASGRALNRRVEFMILER